MCLSADLSSYVFLLTLVTISVSVLCWSYYYLGCELVYRRFFGLVLVFLLAMFMLVFSSDLLALFVAWDLLGFSSFFLVVFFRSRSALGGGLLTGSTNRVGDVLLLSFFGLEASSSSGCCFAPVFFLLLVSFTKSAQVPFSGWLPAAMLAPTPVSALVHSSTLVTAGVYLLYRFYPLPSSFVVRVGLFTILLSGSAAFVECDLKKIIALSTLSHLGLIRVSLGLGERSLCFAHLNGHAAFKALLFVGVGIAIHACYGSQEARSCARFSSSSPFVLGAMVVSLLSLCGFIFLTGWVTKEAILGACVNGYSGLFLLIFFYLSLALTLAYSFRLTHVLFDTGRSFSPCSASVSASNLCKAPVLALVLGAVLQGSCCWSTVAATPCLISCADKVLVFVIVLASLLLLVFQGKVVTFRPSPFIYLSLCSSFTSRIREGARALVATEVSAWHGAGLGLGSSLLVKGWAGLSVRSKGLLFLFLVALLA